MGQGGGGKVANTDVTNNDRRKEEGGEKNEWTGKDEMRILENVFTLKLGIF